MFFFAAFALFYGMKSAGSVTTSSRGLGVQTSMSATFVVASMLVTQLPTRFVLELRTAAWGHAPADVAGVLEAALASEGPGT